MSDEREELLRLFEAAATLVVADCSSVEEPRPQFKSAIASQSTSRAMKAEIDHTCVPPCGSLLVQLPPPSNWLGAVHRAP